MSTKTSAFSAAGATLGYKLGAASVYTLLAQLVNFDEDGREVAKIETTLLAAVAKTSVPSIPDNGTITLTCYDVPGDATVAQLKTLIATPEVGSWQIMYPDGTSPTTGSTDTFSAFPTKVAPKGFAIDGTPTIDVTLQITGIITPAAGT